MQASLQAKQLNHAKFNAATNILQLNVRGINNVMKFKNICCLIDLSGMLHDLIVLTEVKLNINFPLQLYNIRGYKIYSCLRPESKGGGILVYVRNSIQVDHYTATTGSFEKLKVNILHHQRKLRILAYYRAPQLPNIKDFLADVETEMKTSDIKTIIVGDINIDSSYPSTRDPNARVYGELIESFGYKVSNNFPTIKVSGKTIDHLATNFSKDFSIHNATVEIDRNVTDHNIVMTRIDWPAPEKRSVGIITRQNVDYKKLQTEFQERMKVETNIDVESYAKYLIKTIQSSIEASTTTTNFKVKHDNRICEWVSRKLLSLINEKDKLLKKRRRKPQNIKYQLELKRVTDEISKAQFADYKRSIDVKLANKDPKNMWRSLNSILGRTDNRASPSSIISNGSEITDSAGIANEFNSFFVECVVQHSMANSLSGSQMVEVHRSDSMVLDDTSPGEVLEIISQLKSRSASGYDGISPAIVKCLAEQLAEPLSKLVNEVFRKGIYPSSFKIAVVTPIHKAGSKKNLDNYRPISVLTALNKVTEKLIHRRIYNYVDHHTKLLYDSQFGFRQKSGTENAAIELTNMITKAIDAKKMVTAVFMDLRKAFDIVDHKILLEVLYKYGLRGKTNQLLESFLTQRRQVTKVDNICSEEKPILRGVIQGSGLGPLLFLLVINAIGSITTSGRIFLFADDAVLVNIHENENEIETTVRNDLVPVLHFLAQRKMILNEEKTFFMLFSSSQRKTQKLNCLNITSNLIINRVSSYKYLGLYIDDKLNWEKHTTMLAKKLAPANGALWKLRHILPKRSKKHVYDSLFQTHLSFMASIWITATKSRLASLQVLQNRALRNTYNLPEDIPRTEMYLHKVENHLPLRGIAALNIAQYVFGVLRETTFSNIRFSSTHNTHNKNLRQLNLLRPAASRTLYGERSIESIGPAIFNQLPSTIKECNHRHEFKWVLKCYLRHEKFIHSFLHSSIFELKLTK